MDTKRKLFDDEDFDEDVTLKLGNKYAKTYNTWRQKEELNKLHTRYGFDELNSSSSSDDESYHSDGKFEKDFLKTLSLLKSKDPQIYDKNFECFKEFAKKSATHKSCKAKPIFLKDYERQLLEKHGQYCNEEAEDYSKERSQTYVEEQENIKQSFRKALNVIEDDKNSDAEWGGMFKTRTKTNDEMRKENEDYILWLAGQQSHLRDTSLEDELKPLKKFWNNPDLDESEKFLRDYVLNKKFLENDDADYIPTYEEVVHDSDESLLQDEEALDNQEQFEHQYNFRFEEPDQEFIKRYPRTLETSLRKKDNKRKIKRCERKVRKNLEKQRKLQEINKLNELKKHEIEDKINQLKQITGSKDITFTMQDFDDDFDPVKHDTVMTSIFNDEFYKKSEDQQKPEFPEFDKELEIESWDSFNGNKDIKGNDHFQPHYSDAEFNVDCATNSVNLEKKFMEVPEMKKSRKRKSKFVKIISEPKPIFNSNNQTYQEYLDEFYKLDCEDVIGDIQCRFKYREVLPNDFGLTIEEILMAQDKELNRWCSIKKTIQLRPEHVEKYDQKVFEKKGKDINLKRKYLPSLFVPDETKPGTNLFSSSMKDSTVKSNTVSRSKESKVIQKNTVYDLIETTELKNNLKEDLHTVSNNEKKTFPTRIMTDKKNKKEHQLKRVKRKKRERESSDIEISTGRLSAYGINAKKFKNSIKYGYKSII